MVLIVLLSHILNFKCRPLLDLNVFGNHFLECVQSSAIDA